MLDCVKPCMLLLSCCFVYPGLGLAQKTKSIDFSGLCSLVRSSQKKSAFCFLALSFDLKSHGGK